MSPEKPISATEQQGSIQAQLKRILASEEFLATGRQRDFFSFVVRETLAGRSDQIKGYRIATEVLGRNADFDVGTDPIVSIQAKKLRLALERYYLITGKRDPIHINIPRGQYVPVFTRQKRSAESSDTGWPSLLILPFRNLTGNPENHILGTGFASEVANAITRTQEMKVTFQGNGDSTPSSPPRPSRFLIGGNIFENETGIKVTCYLKDTRNGEQIFSDTHQTEMDSVRFLSAQEKIAQITACRITCDFGTISRHLTTDSRDKAVEKLSPYETILRFNDFEKKMTPESFIRATEALQHGVEIEPDNGLLWSMLARLQTTIYSLSLPQSEGSLEKAVEYAEKGVRITPNNQKTVATLGWVHFFNNERALALEEINRAIELSPDSLALMERLGYVLVLLGDWDRGTSMIRKAIRNNPYYFPNVHYALWLDCLRRNDFDRAYLETMGLVDSSLFWVPLAKAATLGLLKRYDEGKKYGEKLLELRPDFPVRGRVLIHHYIKLDELAELVINGLSKVGIEIQ